MPNDLPLPDHLRSLIEKRTGKERRKKNDGRPADNEDDNAVANRQPRDRRQRKNFRDLLNVDDDE